MDIAKYNKFLGAFIVPVIWFGLSYLKVTPEMNVEQALMAILTPLGVYFMPKNK